MHVWNSAFRSMQHRNFRIFFIGQMLSQCGTWVQNITCAWLVYQQTHSALWLALSESAAMLPLLLFSTAGGCLADRLNRKKILIVTSTLGLSQASALALLFFGHHLSLVMLLMLNCLQGIINAFEMPARNSSLPNMVSHADLSNAISLNSSLVSASRLLGSSTGALLFAAGGAEVCFATNALSYLAIIAALALQDWSGEQESRQPSQRLEETLDLRGLLMQNESMRNFLLLNLFGCLLGAQFIMILPAVARDLLCGQIGALGYLLASCSTGSLVVAISLAARRQGCRFTTAAATVSLMGLLFAGLSQCDSLIPSLFLSFLFGSCLTFQSISGQTHLQSEAPTALRGRVIGLWTMFVCGFSPVSSLIAGCTIAHLDLKISLWCLGIPVSLIGLYFLTTRLSLPGGRELRALPIRTLSQGTAPHAAPQHLGLAILRIEGKEKSCQKIEAGVRNYGGGGIGVAPDYAHKNRPAGDLNQIDRRMAELSVQEPMQDCCRHNTERRLYRSANKSLLANASADSRENGKHQ